MERRAEYLDIIGRPSDEEEGHPLMPLIERCLSNSPNLRPNASELVERVNDTATQHPLSFSNRVDMMQRIDSIQRKREDLQTQVSMLEGQIQRCEVAHREQSQQKEAALRVEIDQLRLQVDHLEAEVMLRDNQLSSQNILLSRQRSNIESLHSLLQQSIYNLTSGTQVSTTTIFIFIL